MSCSAPWMNGTSLAKLDSQSIRLMRVVICGYVRYSVELLVAAVHVADDGVGGDDPLAVELDHDPEGAVGGGVLRARC